MFSSNPSSLITRKKTEQIAAQSSFNMSSYNYNQYNPAYDNQVNDRNSQMFWDAVSMTSSDRNSIALSVYHSVPELHYEENSSDNYQSNKNERVRNTNLLRPPKVFQP